MLFEAAFGSLHSVLGGELNFYLHLISPKVTSAADIGWAVLEAWEDLPYAPCQLFPAGGGGQLPFPRAATAGGGRGQQPFLGLE